MFIYIYTYVYMQICLNTCILIYKYIHIHICVYFLHIHIYLFAHIFYICIYCKIPMVYKPNTHIWCTTASAHTAHVRQAETQSAFGTRTLLSLSSSAKGHVGNMGIECGPRNKNHRTTNTENWDFIGFMADL